MDAGQLFAQLRKELLVVARDLYLYDLYLIGLHVCQQEGKKIEAKKIWEKHQIIKESYLKIRALDEKIMSIGELLGIDEASCPFGELDNKKTL